ncbi:hypothetical protein C8R46DRAFT_1055401 [Mycena filopes]|nr:hypothetical protein C8R46DRAFT_1055401 [Mycena filopes]
MGFDSQPFEDAFDAGRTLAPAAVGSQVLTMSAISLVTLVLFNILRPRNKIVYEPKVKYHVGDKSPPRIADTFCGWLPPLLHSKEPELLDKLGLDAVAFLRFLRLMRAIFAGTALLGCAILIPVDFLYNRAHVKHQKRDALSMLTIRDVKGQSIYAHVLVSYLITILVLGFVYLHGHAMVELRNKWFKSPEYMKSFYARTLSIINVPKNLQTDVGLNEIVAKASPYPITSVHMARTVGDLPQLIEYHNQTVRDFEAVLVKFLKGGVHNKARPVIVFGGCCGLGAVHKDAIEYYTNKLKKTEAAVEDYRSRIDARRPENYGFASLAAVPYAHIAARNLAGKHPRGATVTLAPNPKDIIWSNMNKSRKSLSVKRLIGFGWLCIICFLSLIPLLLVAALANLDSVAAAGYLPFLDNWSDRSSATYAIVSGVVPPAVSGLFTVFLPRIMRWLGKYQGALTHAHLDRAVVARYFAFLVISQLIVFTLIGVIINSVTELIELIGKHATSKEIIANLDKLPGRINKTYINTSTYWLKFFPLRGFLVVFDLAQILNLVWISFKTRVFGRTPRDIREWTQPPTFEYAIYYSNLLFMGAVGLIFAPLVPLVALAAAIVFWISSWVYKYQLMFVFVTKVETGGRLWNVIINRVLFSLFLMQCLMILTIGLQISFTSVKMILAAPPILMLVIFKIYIDRKFNKNFYYYLPDEDELRAAHIHSTRSDAVKQKLQNRFGHPSLHSELFTPMVHADQMHLLRQVYGGKIEETTEEGKGARANVEVLDGLRIAAIPQSDLQYDPVLYSRDRGEYDNDRYSLASSSLLSPTMSYYKSNNGTPPPLHYARQSYIGSDVDSPGVNAQSILTSSSGDQRPQSMLSPSLSPPPQGYFEPHISQGPAVQHQPSMQTTYSYIPQPPMAHQGHEPRRPSGSRPTSYLHAEHERQHQSVSMYSQDSAERRASSQMHPQSPHGQFPSHSTTAMPQTTSYPHPAHYSMPASPSTSTLRPQRLSSGVGYMEHSQESSAPTGFPEEVRPRPQRLSLGHLQESSVTAGFIEEVPRRPGHRVFQFGAPASPPIPSEGPEGAFAPPEFIEEMPRQPEEPVFQFGAPVSSSPASEGPTFPEARVSFVEPRFQHQ